MSRIPPDVNSPDEQRECVCGRLRSFVDDHPRTGWYLTVLLALNFLLDLIEQLLD